MLWLFWIFLTEQNGTVFHITFHSMPCCFPLLKHIIVIYNFLRSLFVLFFSKHIFSAWTDMCGAVCASLCPGLNYKTYKNSHCSSTLWTIYAKISTSALSHSVDGHAWCSFYPIWYVMHRSFLLLLLILLLYKNIISLIFFIFSTHVDSFLQCFYYDGCF